MRELTSLSVFGQYAKTNKFEEARNGTMSLLSELTKAGIWNPPKFLRASASAFSSEVQPFVPVAFPETSFPIQGFAS